MESRIRSINELINEFKIIEDNKSGASISRSLSLNWPGVFEYQPYIEMLFTQLVMILEKIKGYILN